LTADIAEIKKSLRKDSGSGKELLALQNTLQAVQRSLDTLKKQQATSSGNDVLGRRLDQLAKLFRAQRRRNLAAAFFLVAALSVFLWATLQASPEIDRSISQPTATATAPSQDDASGPALSNEAVGGAGIGGTGTGDGFSDSGSDDPNVQIQSNESIANPSAVLSTTLPSSTTVQTNTTSSAVVQLTTTSLTNTTSPATTTSTTTTVPTTTVPPITYKPLVATQVSAGRWFSCALDQLGKPYCWGSNFVGSLGDGTSESRAFALPTVGDRSLRTITSHGLHTCGLDTSGVAYCWGNGQPLGSVSSSSGSGPTRVEAPQPFASIHVAASSTCGVTAGGTAFCWGTDAAPIDFRSWRRAQVPIEFDPSVAIGSISAGYVRGCYVEVSGAAYCWPANNNDERPGPLPFPHNFVPESLTGVANGYPIGGHSCARDTTRGWLCWGSNNQGQLGAIDGLQCAYSTTFCSGFFRNALTTEFTTVKAGDGFTCGLRPDGQIWCWGLNNFGQLGRGTSTSNPTAEQLRLNATPTPINSALRFGSVAVGSSHACGITRDTRSVWCWGDNTYGQLGNRSRTNSPTPVEALRRG
jgi:alpha-tubulin suppressor-like RCC1 family protein